MPFGSLKGIVAYLILFILNYVAERAPELSSVGALITFIVDRDKVF